MAFTAGTRLGVYEITGLIGVGGMGEVYKARDTRLDRVVAIKVLPEHIAGDPDSRQRLQREAKAISALSHPHICTLHDIGNEGATEFLVMEYLEGESLAQRLAKGPLPLQQVLRYGVEIAEALDRAHRQGVTHRDLKPGNVMLTKTGAKLLDFGLAKLKPAALQRESGSEPTASPDLTSSGMILGTLQYMAPEQVEGKAVDHRADIFAFGAILYEMATGKKAFEGGSQASLIGAILRDDPQPISALQPLSPAALDALVATCLAKDPDDRWQSAGDLGRQLRLMQGSAPHAPVLPSAATSPRSAWQLNPGRVLGALVAASALAAVALWLFMRPAAEHAEAEIVPAGPSSNDAGATIGSSRASEPERPPSAAVRSVLPNSVAVLPLENLSPDVQNAFYADAMHAEIISQLTKLRNLTVINRDSVRRYAESRPPLQEIASDLRVASILTGRFQYDAGRIRIGVDLVDPTSGANLWTDSYEREFAEIFAVQADIAMSVANALRAEFSAEEQARIERRPTDSPRAHALLLQAQSLLGVGDQGPRMHELIDQAIAIDPEFADAYGFKAIMYSTGLINTTAGLARSPAELEPLIRQYVDKALVLEPENTSALYSIARVSFFFWRWTEAKAAFERVYDINRSSRLESTWARSWWGDDAEALRIGAREIDVDPLSWEAHFTYGIALNYARDYAASVDAFKDGIALAPPLPLQHAWLANTEVARGNNNEARRELRLCEQLLGENRNVLTLLDIAYGFGRIGDREDARRLFDEISEAVRRGGEIGAGGWAVAHLAVGEYDEALDWLRRGAEKAERHEHDAGFYTLMNLKLNYTADPMLELPEFVEVRNRLRGD